MALSQVQIIRSLDRVLILRIKVDQGEASIEEMLGMGVFVRTVLRFPASSLNRREPA